MKAYEGRVTTYTGRGVGHRGVSACTASLFGNDYIILIGGENKSHNLNSKVRLVNTRSSEVTMLETAVNELAPSCKYGRAVYALQQQVFYIGDMSPSPNCVSSLDLETGAWEQPLTTGPRPPKLTGFSATPINTHEIALFGGECQGVATNAVYVLNTQTMEWKHLDVHDAPPVRYYHAAVQIDENTLLIHGGRTASPTSVRTMSSYYLDWRYPSRWLSAPPAFGEYSRAGHTIVSVCGVPVMFGGWSGETRQGREHGALSDFYALTNPTDLSSDSKTRWCNITPNKEVLGRDCHGAASSRDSLWIFGGTGPEFEYLDDMTRVSVGRNWSIPPLTELAAERVVGTLWKTDSNKELLQNMQNLQHRVTEWKKEVSEWTAQHEAEPIRQLVNFFAAVVAERTMQDQAEEPMEQGPGLEITLEEEQDNTDEPHDADTLEDEQNDDNETVADAPNENANTNTNQVLTSFRDELYKCITRMSEEKLLQQVKWKEEQQQHQREFTTIISDGLRHTMDKNYPECSVTSEVITVLENVWKEAYSTAIPPRQTPLDNTESCTTTSTSTNNPEPPPVPIPMAYNAHVVPITGIPAPTPLTTQQTPTPTTQQQNTEV
ncbi:hypothetical protein Pelo_7424 [Pelomyxa schiedti]|nr:hypothetical protein Pelo_7424 [Pelomyxa schiedti]